MENLSVIDGVFIDLFKQVIVTPLIKKPSLSKDDLRNYSPGSGLSFISKVVERIVVINLNHIIAHNLDNRNQSAYKDISLNLTQNKPTALVLLDLWAAFDTTHHLQLRNHLSSWFVFSGRVSKCFLSYMTKQKQSAKVLNSVYSSK